MVVNGPDQLDIWVNSGEALKVDPVLLQELKDRKKMICYHNRQGILEPLANDWKSHAHTAQVLQGAQGIYYYAIEPNIFDVDLSLILPFEKYKETQTNKTNPKT